MKTLTAEYHDWHAWNASPTQWLLSHENTKHLSVWSSVDDLVNFLWFKDRQAARVFNKKFKGKEVKK
tara:strand:- start:1389 stop:1589 length:201 start_codon:yes stop_codon:yes gene_type:complete